MIACGRDHRPGSSCSAPAYSICNAKPNMRTVSISPTAVTRNTALAPRHSCLLPLRQYRSDGRLFRHLAVGEIALLLVLSASLIENQLRLKHHEVISDIFGICTTTTSRHGGGLFFQHATFSFSPAYSGLFPRPQT